MQLLPRKAKNALHIHSRRECQTDLATAFLLGSHTLSLAFNMQRVLCFPGQGLGRQQPPCIFIFYAAISQVPFMSCPAIGAKHVAVLGFGFHTIISIYLDIWLGSRSRAPNREIQ